MNHGGEKLNKSIKEFYKKEITNFGAKMDLSNQKEKISNKKGELNDTVLNNQIQKIAIGTIVVFIGSIIGIFFIFITRVLIARNFSQIEYGIFSIGFTILNIFAIAGSLGFDTGVTRQISYYNAKKETEKTIVIVTCSLLFSFLFSMILFIFLFLGSDIISITIFKLPELSNILKIFSIAIPFFAMIYVLTGIFRGFYFIKERVIFNDIMRNIFFFFLLIFIIIINFSFNWVIISYSLSFILTAIFFIVYFFLKKPMYFNLSLTKNKIHIGKELLIFSIPLLVITIFNQILTWFDTLMIGYYKGAATAGLYNAATPLAFFISSALSSLLFIYMPICSEFYANNKKYELKRSYAILTKWLSSATFPFAMILICFPNIILISIFGKNYSYAGSALQILAIGYFINNLMGPNGATLSALGEIKFLMNVALVSVCLNIILNVFLIPIYGMNGAAFTSIFSLISINIFRSIKLYSISKAHSLEKNILKPLFLSFFIYIIIYLIIKEIFIIEITGWMLLVLFILFEFIYIVSVIVTKSLDIEDISMLIYLENRIGINLTPIKRFLNKFM